MSSVYFFFWYFPFLAENKWPTFLMSQSIVPFLFLKNSLCFIILARSLHIVWYEICNFYRIAFLIMATYILVISSSHGFMRVGMYHDWGPYREGATIFLSLCWHYGQHKRMCLPLPCGDSSGRPERVPSRRWWKVWTTALVPSDWPGLRIRLGILSFPGTLFF